MVEDSEQAVLAGMRQSAEDAGCSPRLSEHLGHDDGVLIVDETGFPKKAIKSAGVQRLYSGRSVGRRTAGSGAFLAYAGPHTS